MDYKSVIEEQIRELQKLQDENMKLPPSTKAQTTCETAKAILTLALAAKHL